MRWRSLACVLTVMGALGVPGVGQAQDTNILFSADSLEYLLGVAPFQLPAELTGTRFEDDRTQRVVLWFDDDAGVLVKWARAPRGGDEFNNSPRYELAAYELQKLFLEEPEYVVPPTVPRMMPLEWYRTISPNITPTFGDAQSVLVLLQYFLFNVTDEEVFDRDRFDADSVYARHWSNANILTYLIDHKDSNVGNLMRSTEVGNPRVFAVDNGVAFRSERSDRGTRWGRLQVDRIPRATVERLRAITEEDLVERLGVLAQFELRGDELVRVEPTENWDPGRGVRERDGGAQIGLDDLELRDVWGRIERLLQDVDRGRLAVF